MWTAPAVALVSRTAALGASGEAARMARLVNSICLVFRRGLQRRERLVAVRARGRGNRRVTVHDFVRHRGTNDRHWLRRYIAVQDGRDTR